MVVSTGVGGGIVLDGRLLDGARRQRRPHRPRDRRARRPRCACAAAAAASRPRRRARRSPPITGRPAAEADPTSSTRTGRLVGRAVASVANLLDLRLAVVAGSVALGFGDAVLRRRPGRARRVGPPRLLARRSHRAAAASATRARSSAPLPSAAHGRAAGSDCIGDRLNQARPVGTSRHGPDVLRRGRGVPGEGPGVPRRAPAGRAGRASARSPTTRPSAFAQRVAADAARERATSRRRGRRSTAAAGCSALEQVILAEEFAKAGVPTGRRQRRVRHPDGRQHAPRSGAPTEQKAHFLPRILSGEDRLVPGLLRAERRLRPRQPRLPGRARRRRVGASTARRSGRRPATSPTGSSCCARTDPDAPKHKGITFLLVPDGPARRRGAPDQDDLGRVASSTRCSSPTPRCPKENVVGGVNGGWAVAMTLLGYERGEAAATFPIMFRTELDRLLALAKEHGRDRRPAHPPAAGVVPHARSRSCATSACAR